MSGPDRKEAEILRAAIAWHDNPCTETTATLFRAVEMLSKPDDPDGDVTDYIFDWELLEKPGVLGVSTNRDGHTFSRLGSKRRCVFVAHGDLFSDNPKLRKPYTPEQIRSLADLFHISPEQQVRFIDLDTLKEVWI